LIITKLLQKRNSIIGFALLFLNFYGNAQNILKGFVFDEQKQSLSGATIIVSNNNKKNVLSYAISNAKGYYELELDISTDSLQVTASFMGFTKQKKQLITTDKYLNFYLKPNAEELREIVLKSQAIQKRGDTLSYSVTSFKGKNDCVISDVLAKMPGIEVLQDGKILYQGEPIQKYYIEGLDLLEGRYNLANNNLPANAVSKVQILENHQPIKVLDSLVFSDKTSLNIKLKKGITRTGTATLGAGLSPLLWNANISPMFFSKKQQLISTYQANNTGDDIANETKRLTLDDFISRITLASHADYLSIASSSKPPFHKKRWLDNNIHLFSINYLLKHKKTLYKINSSFNTDYQQEHAKQFTTISTPNNIIYFIEKIDNKRFYNRLKNNFIIEKNRIKGFFKNDLALAINWNTNKGYLLNNSNAINQEVTNNTTTISNKLKWIKPIKKQLVVIQSNTIYKNALETLDIAAPVFENVFNGGNSFDKVSQKLQLNTFSTDNSLGITKALKHITFEPKIGFTLKKEALQSHITIWNNGLENTLGNDFINNFDFKTAIVYGKLRSLYKQKKWRVALQTPIQYITISKGNDTNTLHKVTFDPRLTISYEINSFWRVSTGLSSKHHFGEINKQYANYILHKYNSIKRYNVPLEVVIAQSSYFGFRFRNPLISTFFAANYSYLITNSNLTYKGVFDSNGATTTGFLLQDNTKITKSLNLRASKYFDKYKTMLATTINFSTIEKPIILNTVLTKTTVNSSYIKTAFNIDLTDKIALSLDAILTNTTFQQGTLEKIKLLNSNYTLKLDYFPINNHYIGLEANLYDNRSQQDYFYTINYHYSDKKRKLDYVLKWNNVLNNKSYTQKIINDFASLETNYIIRPSQLIASIRFNF